MMNKPGLERKILIVDDELGWRTRIKSVLQAQGYAADKGYCFEEADNGANAIDKARSTKYYLITMDFVMPTSDVSGLRAIGEIRTFDTETPIIMISSGSDTFGITDFGGTAYVNKDKIEEKLLGAVRQIYPE